jgi:hypothetical protein
MTIILTGILCVLNVVFDLKLRAILKNENDYLLKYVSKIIKDYDKRPDIKQKDGEKAGDLNTYAMVGYLVLFITTRGVLSYVRIYAIQMVLLLFVALISVFFLQALIYKKLYGEIKKHIKKIVLFGQMTTIAMASGITATILAPTDNSMLQWLMTVVVSLSYAPFYFFVMRASKYLNAIRLQVILEVLNNS